MLSLLNTFLKVANFGYEQAIGRARFLTLGSTTFGTVGSFVTNESFCLRWDHRLAAIQQYNSSSSSTRILFHDAGFACCRRD